MILNNKIYLLYLCTLYTINKYLIILFENLKVLKKFKTETNGHGKGGIIELNIHLSCPEALADVII